MAHDLYAGIPVGDYQATKPWYERLLGVEPSFIAHATEAAGRPDAPLASATIVAVIAGAHTIIFAEEPERARAFLRDVLGFEGVDAGEGWLIFALPPSEVAVHPGFGWGREPGDHALFLMCHDIQRTVAALERKGVEFVSAIEDEGWGRIAQFKIPGAGEIGLYEPRHPSPLSEFRSG